MDTHLLHDHIRQFIELKVEEIEFLDSVLIPRPFKQGEIIIKSGDPVRYLAVVR